MLNEMLIRLCRFLGAIAIFLIISSCQSQAVVSNTPKILLPLYIYPNWYQPESYVWTDVVSAAAQVPIVAIINPNNGPDGQPPNKDYQRGLQDLRRADIKLLGYVYTLYGDRPKTEVINDILLYARRYNLDGIFLDESASNAQQLAYYQEIYQYIKQNTYLDLVVINPGTHTDEAYLSQPAADTAAIFEQFPQAWEEYQPQAYVKNYPSDRFASLIHSVASAVDMKRYIDMAIARNIDYIYVTDDSPVGDDGDPWNSLPSYWQEEIGYLESRKQPPRS